MKNVATAPKPKWTQLAHRRLLNYGGVPHKNGMIAEVIPPWLQTYVEKINNMGALGDKKVNHVLVNEYLAGQGIMPHFDGPLFHPIISTISCGSHTVLELQEPRPDSGPIGENHENKLTRSEKTGQDVVQILVEPRSLLMIKDDAYHKYMHSISEIEEDLICPSIANIGMCEMVYEKNKKMRRQKRVSLTIRHVPKTTKLKLKFGT